MVLSEAVSYSVNPLGVEVQKNWEMLVVLTEKWKSARDVGACVGE